MNDYRFNPYGIIRILVYVLFLFVIFFLPHLIYLTGLELTAFILFLILLIFFGMNADWVADRIFEIINKKDG